MSAAMRAGAAMIAAPFLLAFGVAVAASATGAASPASSPTSTGTGTACARPAVQAGQAIDGVTLSVGQLADAQTIYDVSVSMGLPRQAAVTAIATSMQESHLLNLPPGRGGSLGLFQQRPSQGWGTPDQIMNPVYASTGFYQGLYRVPGWQSLPLTEAAQAVQHSAYPGAYAKWQPLAVTLVTAFAAAGDCLAGSGDVPASGTTVVPADFSLPTGTPLQVVTAIAYALAQLGCPYVYGGTGPCKAGFDCSGLVMKAYEAAGIALQRTTFQQVYEGTRVNSLSQLQPGDLLFTPGSDGTPQAPGHVAMYIGSGLVIQAPETGKPVMITPLTAFSSHDVVDIRRIVT